MGFGFLAFVGSGFLGIGVLRFCCSQGLGFTAEIWAVAVLEAWGTTKTSKIQGVVRALSQLSGGAQSGQDLCSPAAGPDISTYSPP